MKIEGENNIGVVMHGAKAKEVNADRNREIEDAVQWIIDRTTGIDFQLLIRVVQEYFDYASLIPYAFYDKRQIYDKTGKKRIVWEPIPPLKAIQKIINEDILSKIISRHSNSFGFVGGTIAQAMEPHLKSKHLMTMDIVKAFPNTTKKIVLGKLMTLGFPKKVPEVIVKLCTFPVGINNNFVAPQGAPTSPILFELVMRAIDEELTKRAENVGIKCTRFADNFFFSGNDKRKLELMKNTFISIINRSGYQVHKVRMRNMSYPCRMLGLNIINGEIYNTGEFKDRLRAVMFYTRKFFELEKNEEAEHMLAVFNGLLGFVQWRTFPLKQANDIREFKEFLLQRKIQDKAGV